jgi:hypothetical protein
MPKSNAKPPKIGSKVRVQVGKRWLLARVAEYPGDGRVVRVELESKELRLHKSVYAKVESLRPIS